MGSISIANDLIDAVVVTPSQEYAPTCTHNASQVVTQGAPEYFTVQMRDMFGNALTAPMAADSGKQQQQQQQQYNYYHHYYHYYTFNAHYPLLNYIYPLP